jgi:hypothetical protein
MARRIPSLLPVLVLAWTASVGPAYSADGPVVRVRSPNGQVRVELVLLRHGESEAVPHYRVSFKDQPLVLPSRLGIDLADGAALGGPCAIDSVETHAVRAEYAVFPGKRSRVLDHCTEAVVALRERAAPERRGELVLRAYDDGAAVADAAAREGSPGREVKPRPERAAGFQSVGERPPKAESKKDDLPISCSFMRFRPPPSRSRTCFIRKCLECKCLRKPALPTSGTTSCRPPSATTGSPNSSTPTLLFPSIRSRAEGGNRTNQE